MNRAASQQAASQAPWAGSSRDAAGGGSAIARGIPSIAMRPSPSGHSAIRFCILQRLPFWLPGHPLFVPWSN